MVKSIIKWYFRRHPAPISRKKSCVSTSSGHRNYSLYVNSVLKEVFPRRTISLCTVDIMNTLINNMLEHIAVEAHQWMRSRICCTLTPEDVQKPVHFLLPGKLAKYAVFFWS
ncbi:histone H2B subacrosomal variant-like [Octodon degus]|uniref:Histone H2B subacrosomal variant-like n=1 Tax=Octodon degus TaxID=10160 RepID=A0A6P3FZ62_OCTDE|nr:histone H2B subacrosomal variant-like [Octodon degus]